MKWGLLVTLLMLSACSYLYHGGSDSPGTLEELAQKPDSLSYAVVKSYIFDSKCVACHSGGKINLSSYANVKNRLEDIKKTAIQNLTMPPTSPLSASEIKILKLWIDLGAPEFAKDPLEIPPEMPLEPTFKSIQKNILEKRCVACHSSGGSADHIPLTSYNEILGSPREIVIPENVEESGIVIAITRNDDKRMPPQESGDPLSELEIQTIENWILDGAKE